MKALEKIKHNYQNRYSEAKKWKKSSGGKVVGYISAAVPEEMIMAAGLYPLRLAGDINRETTLADRYMEFNFDPIVRSLYDMLLSGEFDFLDLLVIPHASDSVFRLYYYLMENKRQDNPPTIPDLYLLDILYTKWRNTSQYNMLRLKDFKNRLEHLSGKAVTDDDLSKAIAKTNENKRLQQEVREMRLNNPPLFSGADYLRLCSTSMFMKKPDHTLLLKELLKDKSIFSPKPPLRLMFSGNPLDSNYLYKIIEDCNTTIIWEDHDWGSPYADHMIMEDSEPTQAILENYHLNGMSPRLYPDPESHLRMAEKAVELGVHGVLFFFQSHDAAAWDYPKKKKALGEKGIKTGAIRYNNDTVNDKEFIIKEVDKLINAD